MIFPDTQGIQDFELQLLARLVNGFPASNINVILLVNSQSAYDKKLSAFGKNLLQWVLESKDPAPSKPQRLETLGDWPGAQQVPSDKKDDKRPPPPPLPAAPPPPLDLDDVRPGSTEDKSPRDPVMGESVDPLQAANNATAVRLKIRLIFFIASLQCAKNKCCLPNAQII